MEVSEWATIVVICGVTSTPDDFFHFSDLIDWARFSIFSTCGWEWTLARPVRWVLNTFFFSVWMMSALSAMIPAAMVADEDSK